MALIPRSRSHPTARGVGLLLSAGLPFCCYLANAAAHGYWYDAGEFVAASAQLGISHPPGQPLHALVSALFTLVPVGPIAFRVALASACMGALACAALYLAIETTVRAQGLVRSWVVTPIAVGGAWLFAGCAGAFMQALRPEVYALQAALSFWVVERVLALEGAWPTRDVRPLLSAALVWGLSLTNHHFLAMLLLPACSATVARVLRARGAIALWVAAAFVAAGLSVYLYLPLRAAAEPTPNLGAPTSIARMFWVISAQVFQKNAGAGVAEAADERVADVLVALFLNVQVAGLLALAGLYAMVRTPGVRRLGAIWGLLLIVPLLARAWLGFTRSNPDAEGYLLMSFGAVSALSAALFARVVSPLGGLDGRGPTRAAVVVAFAVALLGVFQLQQGQAQASLATSTAVDELDEYQRRRLPLRAIVIAHHPETVFALWGAEAQDHARPDVTIVPMPFLDYPGMVQSLLARDPELIDLMRNYMLFGELRQPELQSLASRRPVMVELDVRVPLALYETLAPAGLYYQVIAAGTTDADERLGQSEQHAMYETLYRRLGAQVTEPGARRLLLWRHYMDSLYAMAYGDLTAAHRSVARARAIEPQEQRLKAMEQALGRVEKPGPMDVRPFLVGAAD